VAHSCGIARISLRSLSLSKGTMRICMSFCLLQSLTRPCKYLSTYCNISGNIKWSYRINGINWLNCLERECNLGPYFTYKGFLMKTMSNTYQGSLMDSMSHKTYRGSLMEPMSPKTYRDFLMKPMSWFLHLTMHVKMKSTPSCSYVC
jgi:hypothetical protein